VWLPKKETQTAAAAWLHMRLLRNSVTMGGNTQNTACLASRLLPLDILVLAGCRSLTPSSCQLGWMLQWQQQQALVAQQQT
jgi:hypothetical protein